MRYLVEKVSGRVVRAALDNEQPTEDQLLIDSAPLDRPELHSLIGTELRPDFSLVLTRMNELKSVKGAELLAVYESVKLGPVVVTNLNFIPDQATLQAVVSATNYIQAHGVFPPAWPGILDANGVAQFIDGRSSSSILEELIDLQGSIVHNNDVVFQRFVTKLNEVKNLDVLIALEEFDTSKI